MSDKLTASLTPQQWDFIGKAVVDILNASSAQARLANETWQSLREQLQPVAAPVVPKANGLQVVDAQ